jgi:hypothetical protein
MMKYLLVFVVLGHTLLFAISDKALGITIDLSGKQRMLTQRITKLSIQCALRLAKKKSCTAMEKYRKEYAQALSLFAKGDREKNIPPTRDTRALKQIKTIFSLWGPFAEALQKLSSSEGKDRTALLYILKHEHTLLVESDRLVKLYETSNQDQDDLQKARLRVVNVAGRERMLTQKMAKEKLLWQELKSEKQKKKMHQTLKLFEASLLGLMRGNAKMGLPKVTNPKIKDQLNTVEKTWKKIKPLFIKETLTADELAILIKVNPMLLREMHRAVGLMEQEVEY